LFNSVKIIIFVLKKLPDLRKIILSTSFLAIIACLLWASAFVGIKLGLPYSSPLQFAGIRFFISGLMILPFAGPYKKYIQVLRKHIKLVLIVGVMNNFIQYAAFYLGLSMVPAALGAIIIGAAPLFVAMAAHFYMPDDKMNLSKLMIFILGIGGIVLVSIGRNNFSTVAEASLIGILLLIFVNIVSGIGNVIVAKTKDDNIPPLVLSSSAMTLGGSLLFIISIPIEGYQGNPKPLEYYVSLLWLSFLSAAAVSIWFILLKRKSVKVSDLNFWKFLIPVAGAVLAWLILPDEKPSLVAILGMTVIALSLILLNIFKKRNSAPPPSL
jgi:drug/metabolite transporter (DMT)-like permease